MIIRSQVHARAGLLGNPSDIYGGKVISFLIRDFAARVRVWESPSLTFRLHPDHDRTEFGDLADLVGSVRRHGYYGMQRLVFATCNRFTSYCEARGVRLRKANFTLEYETDIPRQSGLGGSSAMIIAALRALLRFYRVPARAIPARELAELALSVETGELGIVAGLQDRVVQAYGGLTYMDFSGRRSQYERLDSRRLPRFGIAYLTDEQIGQRESGQVHAEVRYRWEQGDPAVKSTMRELARSADLGREALRRGDVKALGKLMNRNHQLRCELFGARVLGEHTLALAEIAQAAGFPAKLPGSSGAALILLDNRKNERALAQAYAAQGYRFQVVRGL
jgi:glucuronokinase